MMKNFIVKMKFIFVFLVSLYFISCSDYSGPGHVAKSYPEWCAKITDIDLEKEYRTLLFDENAIRDDFSETFNSAQIQMEKKSKGYSPTEGSTPFVWHEGPHLHIKSPNELFFVNKKEANDEYKNRIKLAWELDKSTGEFDCEFETIISMFDDVTIHEKNIENNSQNDAEKGTVINTLRQEKLFSK
jgi:hypothetical protein